MKRLAFLLLLLPFCAPAQTLKTRWAAGVTPGNVWREYPRPQMARKEWTNLNGTWSYLVPGPGATVRLRGKILVPFPIESQLSGVKEALKPGDTLIYERDFMRPKGDRVLLHFGAVDWKATVQVNDKIVGTHTGGYDPFTFDITDALKGEGSQHLVVRVTDPTDSNWQPRGKQVVKPGGIFYTSTSGIWQTVWLEGVPRVSVDHLKIDTWPRAGQATVTADFKSEAGRGLKLRVEAIDGSRVVARSEANVGFGDNLPEAPGYDAYPTSCTIKVPNAKWWSPEHPFLHGLRVTVLAQKTGEIIDQVQSYFAFREIGLTKKGFGTMEAEQPRFALNGKPYFLIGPLDQGFWPDGIYTPPSDAAMKYDLEVTKRLGFNMIRKHVKVEPDRWYYWCDKLGICVLQDMPSGDKFIGPNDRDIQRSRESADDFKQELQALIDTRRNHPSIVTWVLYNEGWGQWNTGAMTDWLKAYDTSRLVDSVTGWADRGVGDFLDWHVYPGPGAPPNQQDRAIFLGEFGGLGLPVPGHMWQEKGWGYQSFKTSEELTNRFVGIFRDLRFLQGKGLSGAVYTQTTDCETELNGLMTYDRAMVKMDEKRVRQAVRDLFLPPPTVEQVVPTSESEGQNWRYTFSAPSPDWVREAFDDSGWRQGQGGFGTPETPGSIVRTRWDTKDIWLRRFFTLDRDYKSGELFLRVSYDDDVEVYIDGERFYKAPGWTTSYELVGIGRSVAKGPHTMAVHCHQNEGGQYVDAGLVRIRQTADHR